MLRSVETRLILFDCRRYGRRICSVIRNKKYNKRFSNLAPENASHSAAGSRFPDAATTTSFRATTNNTFACVRMISQKVFEAVAYCVGAIVGVFLFWNNFFRTSYKLRTHTRTHTRDDACDAYIAIRKVGSAYTLLAPGHVEYNTRSLCACSYVYVFVCVCVRRNDRGLCWRRGPNNPFDCMRPGGAQCTRETTATVCGNDSGGIVVVGERHKKTTDNFSNHNHIL